MVDDSKETVRVGSQNSEKRDMRERVSVAKMEEVILHSGRTMNFPMVTIDLANC